MFVVYDPVRYICGWWFGEIRIIIMAYDIWFDVPNYFEGWGCGPPAKRDAAHWIQLCRSIRGKSP